MGRSPPKLGAFQPVSSGAVKRGGCARWYVERRIDLHPFHIPPPGVDMLRAEAPEPAITGPRPEATTRSRSTEMAIASLLAMPAVP